MQLVSTEASPPPGLTFASMLAGLLGMLAAALLLVWQPEALFTRWHPAALAAVHLFALGGLMPVMLGALYQFVPVACGLALPRWGGLDWLILFALLAGAFALAGGFLFGGPLWLASAGVLLLGSLLAAGVRLAWSLWHQPLRSEMVAALRRSALALGGTLTLGAVLLGVLLFGWPLPLMVIVDWHALWGIAGWVSGLVVSVASVVVPMFHVTQAYPRQWNWATRGLLLALLLGSAAAWLETGWLASAACVLLTLLGLGFGILTAQRVRASKRGERDAFHWGWLGVAAISVLLAVLGALAHFSPDPRWSVVFGVLALAGLGGGTVSVMLYRIVPFLIWLHWQRANKARARLPLLHQIVPERWQRVQLASELMALVLLCLAAFVPALTQAGALLLAMGKLGQTALLARAMRDYRQRLAILKTLPPRVRT
ncbi:hypothetical protein Q9Q94_07050 [Uliginosibacterium sp. 31-16]|uniref:hypothetical protein n=1 Tax=Uliginosibacterium sp. 31-16 TaxID=3068315 RepID=UPI00273F1149|nr:hypothetical protein [Uliginosibacterium sp. 31-16]MDP5239280.1 hypothetical protein [Uliginosibacterium sp. 31-16]